MDFVVVDILLALVRSINMGLGTLGEITPSDATDIRGLSVPVGTASFANGFFGGFEIEHILADDGEGVSCVNGCTTIGTAVLFLMEIVIGTVCIRENNSQHSIGIAGVSTATLGFAFSGTQGERDLPRNPLVLFLHPGNFHSRGDEYDGHSAVENTVPELRPDSILFQLRKIFSAGFTLVDVAGGVKVVLQLIHIISYGGIALTGKIGNLVISMLIRYENFVTHKLSS